MLGKLANFVSIKPLRAPPPMDTRLIGPRVSLRMGEIGDWQMWRDERQKSRKYLVPWEPQWPANALEHRFFGNMLRRQWREWRRGHAFGFMVFLREGNGPENSPLIGGINLNNVQYGTGSKGTLGYWLGQDYANHGYMTEAATLVCNFAFAKLGLSRLEASCLPHNEASKKVLQRIGFEEFSYAKNYLRINGVFEDHLLWRMIRPQTGTVRPVPSAAPAEVPVRP